jgi:hypothetical protein
MHSCLPLDGLSAILVPPVAGMRDPKPFALSTQLILLELAITRDLKVVFSFGGARFPRKAVVAERNHYERRIQIDR